MAEVSLIRRLPSFLPLIGKLHEREVRSWLWIEDDMVLLDMKGADLARLLESGLAANLVTSGVSSLRYEGEYYHKVMGRWLVKDAYYRIATTNVIYEGVFNEYFINAIRVKRKFIYKDDGRLEGDRNGTSLSQRDYVLQQLKRIRAQGKGKDHHRNVANILDPDPRFERLLSFRFDNPTLWTSLNRIYKGEGYESVPESRIGGDNSFVIGVSGGMTLTYDERHSALDWTVNFGFAQIRTEPDNAPRTITENLDDFVASMSYRYKGPNFWTLQPLARVEYDTEFTPTLNKETALENPRQNIVRGILGITRARSRKWLLLEAGLSYEFDFVSGHAQYGVRARSRGRFPLDKGWRVVYALTNNFDYYFPTPDDTERELSIRYNMVNELSVPLFGELSLTLAADFFVFRGKLETNRDFGMSMLYRVGITYNRTWKPRFQGFL